MIPAHRRTPLVPLLLAAALVPSAWANPQDLGSTAAASQDDNGVLGNNHSAPQVGGLAVSEDGRFVVFVSRASNLAPGDTNGREDAFLRDTHTGTTVRASVGDSGQEGNGDVIHCDVSDDGRYVAFSSTASNLVPGDTNGFADVFLRDMLLGTTALVTRTPQGGVAPGGPAAYPTISSDGSRVAFESPGRGLVPVDTNLNVDVFVYERATGAVTLVSQTPGGQPGDRSSGRPHISPDGGWVAFQSDAGNLGPADPNGFSDVYVRELATGTTLRLEGPSGSLNSPASAPRISQGGAHVAFKTGATNVLAGGNVNGIHIVRWERATGVMAIASVDASGAPVFGTSDDPEISYDGQWVAFRSFLSGLVPGDTNGQEDVFVRRMDQGWTERVSVAGGLGQLSSASRTPSLSGSGRFTAFTSNASGVVAGDNNQATDVFLRDRGHDAAFAGAEYCASVPNSTGVAARTFALGNPRLSARDVTLASTGVPPGQFGFYFMSETVGLVPAFGSSLGTLCVGGTIYRLDAHIVSSTAQGRTGLAVPFQHLPTGASFAAGARWNFQLWFRDVVGGLPTSNTSSAVGVLWR